MSMLVLAQCPIVGVLQICRVCCLNYDAEKERVCWGEKKMFYFWREFFLLPAKNEFHKNVTSTLWRLN